MPLGKKSKCKSITRNCLHSLISYGPQSASLFSIINNQLGLGFSFFVEDLGLKVFVFSPPIVYKNGWMKFEVDSQLFFPQEFIKVQQRCSARARICREDLRRYSPWRACAGRVLWSFRERWSVGWPSLAFVFSTRWRQIPSDVSGRTWWLWAGSPRLWTAFLWC